MRAEPLGHETDPDDAVVKPAMMRRAVDLPQPEGPSSETNSPLPMSSSKSSSARTPFANVLLTLRNSTRPGADSVLFTNEDNSVPYRAVVDTATVRPDQFFGRRSTPTPLLTNCNVKARR